MDSLKICREAYMSTPPVAGERYEFVVRKWKGSEPVVIGTLPRVVVVAEFVDIAKSVFNEREIVELKTKDGVETRPTLLRFLGGFDMKGRTFAFSCLTGKGEKVEKEDDDSDTDESDDEEGEKEEETAPKGEIVGYSLTA